MSPSGQPLAPLPTAFPGPNARDAALAGRARGHWCSTALRLPLTLARSQWTSGLGLRTLTTANDALAVQTLGPARLWLQRSSSSAPAYTETLQPSIGWGTCLHWTAASASEPAEAASGLDRAAARAAGLWRCALTQRSAAHAAHCVCSNEGIKRMRTERAARELQGEQVVQALGA